MRFVIDANLPRSIVALITGLGQITRVVEQLLREAAFLAQLSGRLAIVEADRVRFRPPLS